MSNDGTVYGMKTDKGEVDYDRLSTKFELRAVNNDFIDFSQLKPDMNGDSNEDCGTQSGIRGLHIVICDFDQQSLALIYGTQHSIKAFSFALNSTVEMRTEVTEAHQLVLHDKCTDIEPSRKVSVNKKKKKESTTSSIEIIKFLLHVGKSAF